MVTLLAELARRPDISYARVAKGDDVGPAVREALGNDRPTVIEVPMDRLPSPF
jgi:thiamine pyrophosphate-dependent acetolactate synthase large subunit-like protein